MTARQLSLVWPTPAAYGREDFLVTPASQGALGFIERWPDWPARCALLIGPPGSGKTHLAAIWAEAARADRVQAADLDTDRIPALLAGGALVIEDIAAGGSADPLFHAFNLARETSAWLLLTASIDPAQWRGGLPDLVSRLRALPRVAIGAPDEALLRAVLVKLFMDRQLLVDQTVIDYMVPRMERSLDAVRALVAVLDDEALSRGRRITRAMAAEILSEDSDADEAGAE